MSNLVKILKAAKVRLTEPRKEVFRALELAKVPLTTSDIVRLCSLADRASVYRTLDIFVKLNIITTVYVGNKTHYELAEPFVEHHHHLYCTVCKNAAPIYTTELETMVKSISASHGFRTLHHHFELEGVCQSCQSQNITTKD